MAGFDDGKDEGALRTIGEVSEALGIKAHILRYWEQQFPLLRPLKRSGGRRYYRPADVAMVEAIDRLINREGYTLKGAEAAAKWRAFKRYLEDIENRSNLAESQGIFEKYLPYATAMAQRNSQYTPVVLELKGAGVRFLEGRPRSLVRQVAGHGVETVTWLVQADRPASATITATTATAWGDETSVQIGGAQ